MFPVKQNIPVPVHWAGFVSDTLRLGREGWQIAMEQNPMARKLSLIMHHPGYGLTAYGVLHDYDGLREAIARPDVPSDFGRMRLPQKFPPFVITNAGTKDYRFMTHPSFDLADFHRVDTMPTIVQRESSYQELPLFAELFAPKPEAQQLIVDPQDVQSMLDQVLKIQGPMRKEIRARDQRRDRDEPQTAQVHAQIITLRAA